MNVRHRALRAWQIVNEIRLDLLALVWPCVCVVCGAADRDLCRACEAELLGGAAGGAGGDAGTVTGTDAGVAVAVAVGVGVGVGVAADVGADAGTDVGAGAAAGADAGARAGASEADHRWVLTPSGVHVCVAGPYAGPLRAVLVAYKHAGSTRFARHLGARLRAPLRAALAHARSPAPLAVTVPSRQSRVRERGYRHVDLLVRRALSGERRALARGQRGLSGEKPSGEGRRGDARALFIAGVLRATAGRTGQVGLTAADRQANAERVRVPRRVRELVRGREVVLIDDIITTGATVEASSRALAAAGAKVIAVVAVCATERLDRKGADAEKGCSGAT